MKIRNITFLLTIFMASIAAMSAQDAVFNVATYNIRQLNDGDTRAGNGWQQRAPIIAQLALFHDFDIFGTQEGFKQQLDDLKAAMPGYEYIGHCGVCGFEPKRLTPLAVRVQGAALVALCLLSVDTERRAPPARRSKR